MATFVKVDTLEVDLMLELHTLFVEKTMPQLVRKYARIACVELANRTQPFSVGAKKDTAQRTGQKAVTKGINHVFSRRKFLQVIVDKTTNENLKERLQKMVSGGQWDKLAKTMMAVGMFNDVRVIAKSQMPETHKARRNKRTGRTFKQKGRLNFARESNVIPYTIEIAKRVGKAKSGWADCARKIGGIKGDGTRGIPAFAKSKNHGIGKNGNILDIRNDKKNPRIIMTNTIPWSLRVCRPTEQTAALMIARIKMIKEANTALSKAAKNKFQEPITS